MRLSSVLFFALYCCGCATTSLSPARKLQLLLQKTDSHSKDIATTGLYLCVAQKSLALSTDRHLSDQEQAEVIHLYNKAVTGCLVCLTSKNTPLLSANGNVVGDAEQSYRLHILTNGPGILNPVKFDRFISAGQIQRKQLKRDVERPGIGASFVGLQNAPTTDSPNRSPFGFAQPVTTVISFGRESFPRRWDATISLLDPREDDFVTLDRTSFRLRGDFTAALAYFPKKDGILFGFLSMLQSDRVAMRQGIYFIEPFNPDKIPVLFVHGLASSPHAWMEFVNNLNSDPEFRRHYQVWVYLYPSGTPIVVNALRLRTAIEDVSRRYTLKHKIVIIGHSMGGILARLQVSNSGDTLWDSLFGAKADKMRAEFPADSLIKKSLFFQASPHVGRVIFIATPHRGSNLALIPIASIPSILIRMPNSLVRHFNNKLKSALRTIDPSLKSIPTSITGLSPKSRLLKAMNTLPIEVPYHSIIGNRGFDQRPLAQSSDGVVPYWSSHIEGADSELIVPTGHDAFKSPCSVNEVLRILKKNEVDEN